MVLCLIIIGEPLSVLYSRCFGGASVVLQRFFGMTEGLYSTATMQNLLSSCMVLQRFFSGSLAWLRGLYSTATMQNLLSSCMVLQRFFGMTERLYSTATMQNLLSSCMVLQRFFSGSLAWLRGYIAPLPMQNLLSSCMVLQLFFGMTEGLYSTATTQNLLSSCMVSSAVLSGSWHDWEAI